MRKTLPIDVVSLRANNYSPDRKSISISLATKHSTEMTLSVPVTCLHELIADLRKLQSSSEAQSDTPSTQPTVTPAPAVDTKALDPNRVNVTVPKKWMLASGLPKHPVVIIVFDPQTKSQAGYALPVPAARDMAACLVKYADTVAKHVTSNQKQN